MLFLVSNQYSQLVCRRADVSCAVTGWCTEERGLKTESRVEKKVVCRVFLTLKVLHVQQKAGRQVSVVDGASQNMLSSVC